ncbi:BTAD domain-containing putative transcriptional regulator [Jiangella alba]|uniref:DNA-binding transcriptional activator of the SARP family n=1 Tax=Jiangella alba TaxID=561176 RepID=A0A1H5PHU4_9ACTN|nr:BTAD domain-containing putative transcriptional regulator [Jiangella alba]SEF13350.1 DNA-binding transcriptional activator of the SARP family [Jiangella alba]
MSTRFGVLGPVAAWTGDEDVDLKGPRHREVLARLIVARGRVVPVRRIVTDLWESPPDGAVVAVRTFVAALRRALEPHRAPRTPATLLVTEGPGYALRAGADAVDAWRFGAGVEAAGRAAPAEALALLDDALALWRGPAYADFAAAGWAAPERTRLTELRLTAVERRAEALLALGRSADAVPDLDAHVAEHPWREDAWRLLALALYRTGRQADALDVLRRARSLLGDELGVDPGPRLRQLETDLLRQELPVDAVGRVWADAAAAFDQTVAAGAPGRLESTVGLLRVLALTGGHGLAAAQEQRVAAVAAAEQLGDPELTARVIGSYDVPGVWTRSDHPDRSARVVGAAERTLAALPPSAPPATRARLLATVAMESRGSRSPRPAEAAAEAERIARRLHDPALLAFALNATFLQTFQRAGLAPSRDAIGAELVALAAGHGLSAFEILGRLVRMQARAALGDFGSADEHAAAADELGLRHDRPLVGVFTRWYRAVRLASTGGAAAVGDAEAAYRAAAARLEGAGMPGLERGLLPLALLCLRVWHDRPLTFDADTDWGPYAPWARPLLLLAHGGRAAATAELRVLPEPPRDLLFEATWCLAGRAALLAGDHALAARARAALTPAAGELAGAGSGVLTAGPVALHLAALDDGLSAAGH